MLKGGIPSIEGVDARIRLTNQCCIGGERFRGGVGQIGEQRKMEVWIAVGKKANFKSFKQPFDCRGIGEHRGDRNERAVLRRDAGSEVEPWQGVGADNQRGDPGGQSDAQVQSNQRCGQSQQYRPPWRTGGPQEATDGDRG